MNSREILIAMVMLATLWHTAVAQPKKTKITLDVPPPQGMLGASSVQPSPALSDLMARQPEMPLGPQDVLKSYEIAMSLLADKTSADFNVIVQAQQANQITREQAETLLAERYQVAMMQYQVLSALHDVLKHDIDEAAGRQTRESLKTTSDDTVLVVPLPDSAPSR